jgi:hypothetical protein
MVSDVIGIGKAVEPLAKATSELILAFLKPGTDEVGGWIADRVRISRQKNVERVLSKAKPVAAKTLFAIAEACSLEDDDEMIERWANLLAAAATSDSVLPSYVDALAKLSPAEAKVLDAIQKVHKHVRASESLGGRQILAAEFEEILHGTGLPISQFQRIIASLQRLGLLRDRFQFRLFTVSRPKAGEFVGLTEFGSDFLSVCNRKRGA